MPLMQMLGPQFESQYKLDIANEIIQTLMGARQGKTGQSKPSPSSAPQAGQAGPAQQQQQMASPLGPGFYQMFNTAPNHMQSLVQSLINPRGGRAQ